MEMQRLSTPLQNYPTKYDFKKNPTRNLNIWNFRDEDPIITEQHSLQKDLLDKQFTTDNNSGFKKSLSKLSENYICEFIKSKFYSEPKITQTDENRLPKDEVLAKLEKSIQDKGSLDNLKEISVENSNETPEESVPALTIDANKNASNPVKIISKEDLIPAIHQPKIPSYQGEGRSHMSRPSRRTTVIPPLIADPAQYASKDVRPSTTAKNQFLLQQADTAFLCQLAEQLFGFNHDIQYADLKTRQSVIKLVFLYLTALLGITEGLLIAFFFTMDDLKDWKNTGHNSVWFLLGEPAAWTLIILAVAAEPIRRVKMVNIVFLVLTVALTSFFVGTRIRREIHLSCMVSTAIIILVSGLISVGSSMISFYANELRMQIIVAGLVVLLLIIAIIIGVIIRDVLGVCLIGFFMSTNMLIIIVLCSIQMFNGRLKSLTTDEHLYGASLLYVCAIWILSVASIVLDAVAYLNENRM